MSDENKTEDQEQDEFYSEIESEDDDIVVLEGTSELDDELPEEEEPETDPEPAAESDEEPPAPDAGTQLEPGLEEPTEAPETPPSTEPQSAEAILAEMGLLPQGFQQDVPVQWQPQQQPVQQQAPPVQQPAYQQNWQQQQAPPPSWQEVVDQQVEMLAQNHYALDSETVEELEAAGEGKLAQVLPRLTARGFVDAVQVVQHHIAQTLPQMMEQYHMQQDINQRSADAFYGFWEQRGFNLRDFDSDLEQIGAAYVQANPQISQAQAIQDIGAQLIISRQLQPNGSNQTQPQQQPQGQPFVSAAGTGASKGPSPQKGEQEQFYEDLVDDPHF